MRVIDYKLVCCGCADCIVRFKCYTNRYSFWITWDELREMACGSDLVIADNLHNEGLNINAQEMKRE